MIAICFCSSFSDEFPKSPSVLYGLFFTAFISVEFRMLLFLIVGRLIKIGSFGFAKGQFVCRAKPNVPIVSWQKNKKMWAGQKLNLSGSVCVSPYFLFCLFVLSLSLYFLFLTAVYHGCSVFFTIAYNVCGI